MPMPCSWTPAEPRCLASTALRCCPPTTEREGPRRPWSFRSSITRPQHWLFTLRAAITGDDAKLASGVWPVFPGWDSSLPTEFWWEVSALRLPPPLGFACRDSFSSCKTIFKTLRAKPVFRLPDDPYYIGAECFSPLAQCHQTRKNDISPKSKPRQVGDPKLKKHRQILGAIRAASSLPRPGQSSQIKVNQAPGPQPASPTSRTTR